MSQTKNQKKQLNLLQVFRGIAALLVLLYHGTSIVSSNLKQDFLANIFIFGHTGVNFFFVLSGFIIFYIHQSDVGKKSKFKDFILKRLIRVYPIYWIVLILRLILGGSGKEVNLLTIVSSFLLFPYPSPPIVSVSWTLSYEVFFYIIFSFLILIGLKYLKPLIVTWLILISLHSASILTFSKEHLLLNFIFSHHIFEFCFGCLAAYIVTKYKVKCGSSILVLGIVLFSLSSIATVSIVSSIADNTFALKPRIPMEDQYSYIFYGIPSMLIIIGAASLDLTRKIQIPNLFIYIGNASYSIYLTHATVINISTSFIAKMHLEQASDNYAAKSFILVIALLTGCIFYSYIEQPLLIILRKNIFSSKKMVEK